MLTNLPVIWHHIIKFGNALPLPKKVKPLIVFPRLHQLSLNK